MSVSTSSIEQLAINTIRTLSMDGVQAANSGHPGTPMALAPVTYALWNNALTYDPAHPHWPARDRFILSCGHASMLLYSTLHVAGVKAADGSDDLSITLDNIRNFRQMGSPCAGHPEYEDAAGIETTTGPLGQGVGNSVGMAMAAKWFAARYNTAEHQLFDYNTYALCSDGDVMEGIGCEAASVAGHLKLDNLCWIYDDNHITIEGDTDLAFTEDVGKRFDALGWNVVHVDDANDLSAIDEAIAAFKACTDKPTIIVLRSIIGYGSPNKANTHGAHGAPLGEEEVKLTKAAYGWPEDEKFHVPAEVLTHFEEGLGARGKDQYAQWNEQFAAYEAANPEKAAELKLIWNRELPAGWDKNLKPFDADAKGMATRQSSGKVLNMLAPELPWLVGGSADLAPSNNTLLTQEDAGHFSAENYGGRNLHFGVREHSMAAICNGMSLSGIRSYGATFFVFTDYMRPSMRLSSIMHQPVLYVLTHDSIGLGEDGPTHQPVEHLAACRAIPGLTVYRPGDANEVLECYRAAISRTRNPAAMVLTRQGLPTLCREEYAAASGCAKGGYVLAGDDDPQVILMASGSELEIAVDAFKQLQADGVKARIVSMPSINLFEEQDQAYRDSVLPPSVTARVAVEAGLQQSWDRYLGLTGKFVGMTSFGASAPYKELYEKFAITAENVVAAAKSQLG